MFGVLKLPSSYPTHTDIPNGWNPPHWGWGPDLRGASRDNYTIMSQRPGAIVTCQALQSKGRTSRGWGLCPGGVSHPRPLAGALWRHFGSAWARAGGNGDSFPPRNCDPVLLGNCAPRNAYPASPLYCHSLFPWSLGGSRWQVSIYTAPPNPGWASAQAHTRPWLGGGRSWTLQVPSALELEPEATHEESQGWEPVLEDRLLPRLGRERG